MLRPGPRPGRLRAPSVTSLGQTLVRSIESRGSEVTLRDSVGGSLTGTETVDRAFRVAHALRRSGLGPDDRVAIMGDDRVETIVVYLGCFIAGVTAVHVNARLQSDEVEHILSDSGAQALIAGADVDEVIGRVAGLDDLRFARSIGGTALGSYDAWIDGATASRSFEPRLADDLAIVGYTSGTTGRPKGALATERAVGGCLRLSSLVFRIPLRSSLAFSGSLSFIGATWGQVFPHLFVGGSVDLLGKYDIDSWFDHMAAAGTTFTYVPTPHMREFAARADSRRDVLDRLVTVFHTGSLAPPSWARELNDVVGGRYLEAWGMTESVGALTVTTAADHSGLGSADDIYSSGGRAVPFAEVWAEGPDGRRLGPGEDGELVARSETMVAGYLGHAGTIGPNGTYRTGDVGHFDDAGYVYVTGRASDLIVSGGMNVYPAEVERALVDHDDIRAAAVFGIPHERWGESVGAAIVRREGSALDEEAVTAHVKRRLASYKKPTRIYFVDELPHNASHKVDKRRLKEMFPATS